MNPQDTETFEVRLYYSFTVMFGFKPLTCLRLQYIALAIVANLLMSIGITRTRVHKEKGQEFAKVLLCHANQKLQKCTVESES